MTKQELALEVIERLKKEYPDADCTLDYDNAWKLLVSVRLAAQCTDARVNIVVQDLYAKFPTVEALANADVADIEAIVRPCGLGKSKARDISACMKILHEQYHDNVPGDFDALLKLPGVGRKSANLIMGDVFGKPAIVTDTHCIRLSNRIGLVDNMKEPKKVEMALWKIIPPEEGNDLCHRLVNHGRDVCTARTKPYCDRCCLNDICEKKWCRPLILQAGEEEFIEVVFPSKLRRVFTSTVGTSSHSSIKFFSGCDQIHLINLISQFPTLRTESGKRLFCLSGVHQFLPDITVFQCFFS